VLGALVVLGAEVVLEVATVVGVDVVWLVAFDEPLDEHAPRRMSAPHVTPSAARTTREGIAREPCVAGTAGFN